LTLYQGGGALSQREDYSYKIGNNLELSGPCELIKAVTNFKVLLQSL